MTGRIRSFTSKDAELNRKLVQLEDSFSGEVDALKARVDLSVVTPVLRAGYIARAGQLVRVLKPVELLLAKPKQDDRGRQLVVWNGSGGVVTLRPVESTLDGLETRFLSGAGAFVHDGGNWFSVGSFNSNRSFVRVGLAAVEATAAGVEEIVPFDTEELDAQGEFDPSTFTYTSRGYRRLSVKASMTQASGAGDIWTLRIKKNGVVRAESQHSFAGSVELLSIQDSFAVVPGDTVAVFVFQSNGARNIGGNPLRAYLVIEEVAA